MTVLNRKLITRMVNPQPGGNGGGGGAGGAGAYVLPAASNSELGGIKLGYPTGTGKFYPVQLDNQQRAYVDVPWENTWRPLGTGATDACAGNDSRLSDARPASDVYSWAKAATKPSYNLDEVADGTTRKLSNYLPLAGGTMTGILKVATGYGISDATSNGLLVYHPVDWTGVTSSQWGVGAVDSEGVIRSSNNTLKHYRDNDGTYEIIESKGGQTIANSLQIASVKIEQTNEVNSYQGALHLNYRVASDVTACIGGGNFGIGTYSPSYKLHVAGTIYATGSITERSDIRCKDVETYQWSPTLDMIADAPIIRYTMKDDKTHRMRVGSVAQYWEKMIPETVSKDNDGILSIAQGDICMVSIIALGREVRRLREEVKQLKKWA